jgi:hypothetical protein
VSGKWRNTELSPTSLVKKVLWAVNTQQWKGGILSKVMEGKSTVWELFYLFFNLISEEPFHSGVKHMQESTQPDEAPWSEHIHETTIRFQRKNILEAGNLLVLSLKLKLMEWLKW